MPASARNQIMRLLEGGVDPGDIPPSLNRAFLPLGIDALYEEPRRDLGEAYVDHLVHELVG